MSLPGAPAAAGNLAAGLLLEYGYAALFAVFVLEGAMLLYFAPSESLVPVAIVSPLAGSPPEYGLVIAVAVAGATTGQFLLFTAAKRKGRGLLLGSRWVRISTETVERFDGWFARWGPVVVPVSNTLLFTRGMFTVPAGLAGMGDARFVAYSALGTLVFETVLAALTLGLLDALA